MKQEWKLGHTCRPYSSVGESAIELGELDWWFKEIDPVMQAIYGYGRRECCHVNVYRLSDGRILMARDTAEGAILWYDMSAHRDVILMMLEKGRRKSERKQA